ncbi:hypothetical protein [Nocardioides caldifontis]|uniref:hypothetical protein n=1 Tax=Nocardioides caldifontis TaxID=2588938 RepID=UPI0011DF6627|nr:hypothetical protein [Nocardioides caldifontis]
MELLDVSLTELQRRNRAAFVACAELDGELSPGERVVLRDDEGEYFSASVVDTDEFAGEDRYLLKVGVRLPEEHAMRRLGRVLPSPRSAVDDDMDELLDLLADARAMLAGASVPPQRRG